jgi:hypothetical protein
LKNVNQNIRCNLLKEADVRRPLDVWIEASGREKGRKESPIKMNFTISISLNKKYS